MSALRPRIVVISQLPPPLHGSTVMTATLLDVLAGRLEVDLVDRRFSRTVDEVGAASPRKVFAAVGLVGRAWRAAGRRPGAIVFFITSRRGSFLVDSLVAETMRLAMAVRRHRAPVVLYIHTRGYAELYEAGGLWRRLVVRLFRFGDAAVTLSPLLDVDIARLIDGAKVTSIANTVNAGEVATARGLARRVHGDALRVLFLSNLIPMKGTDAFIRLASELTRRGVGAEFRMVGAPGPADYMRGVTAELTAAIAAGVPISHVGPRHGSDKWQELVDADLLVFPSLTEALPLTILESLSVGTPVVAFGVGGIPDLVRDGQSGAVVALGDERALAEATLALMTQPDELRRRGAEATADFDRRFSIEAYRANWEALFARLGVTGRP